MSQGDLIGHWISAKRQSGRADRLIASQFERSRSGATEVTTPETQPPVKILPLLVGALMRAVMRFFERLFGRR